MHIAAKRGPLAIILSPSPSTVRLERGREEWREGQRIPVEFLRSNPHNPFVVLI